jgi:hypothetical protein
MPGPTPEAWLFVSDGSVASRLPRGRRATRCRGTKITKLWTVDHSARRSMKNAANCAKHGELQGFMKPLLVERILRPQPSRPGPRPPEGRRETLSWPRASHIAASQRLSTGNPFGPMLTGGQARHRRRCGGPAPRLSPSRTAAGTPGDSRGAVGQVDGFVPLGARSNWSCRLRALGGFVPGTLPSVSVSVQSLGIDAGQTTSLGLPKLLRSTSGRARLPAEFKHITERRKRKQR